MLSRLEVLGLRLIDLFLLTLLGSILLWGSAKVDLVPEVEGLVM